MLTLAPPQVRFGVLNAGNFGVSQSRKRTFIWGVAPGSHMPDWPTLLHVFRSPQLTINLPGGVQARPPSALHPPLFAPPNDLEGRPGQSCWDALSRLWHSMVHDSQS